jgi:uncharacterized membrane-anchored protein YhcB (DUF1043 family)
MLSLTALWGGFAALGWVQRLWKYRVWIIAGVTALALSATIGVLKWKLHSVEATAAQSSAALTVARHDLDLARQSSVQWQDRSAQQQQEIDSLNRQLSQRIADSIKADLAEADLEDAHQQQIADLTAKLRQLKEQAHAHPDQVRPLGPLAVGSLSWTPGGPAAAAAGH